MKAALALLTTLLLAMVVILGVALVNTSRTNATLAQTTQIQAGANAFQSGQIFLLQIALGGMCLANFSLVTVALLFWRKNTAVAHKKAKQTEQTEQTGQWLPGPNANWGRTPQSPYALPGGVSPYPFPPMYAFPPYAYPYPQQALPAAYYPQQPGGTQAGYEESQAPDSGNPFIIQG